VYDEFSVGRRVSVSEPSPQEQESRWSDRT